MYTQSVHCQLLPEHADAFAAPRPCTPRTPAPSRGSSSAQQ
ncbi:hypothetical protein PhCBS80983_g04115 [Powellomyces hirtus]|uniref:Uncharacterized protein n=1 Tax=Powellomyces hirtus TaxID=109895 RepID=A0A507DZX6_9FUNG|nr:hypothetical protein PhCBS80983_g04115 [Powellomyces hirtus]